MMDELEINKLKIENGKIVSAVTKIISQVNLFGMGLQYRVPE